MTATSSVHQDLRPTPRGFELRFSVDQGPQNRIDWLRPNGMELHILEGPQRLIRIHAWCIPAEPGRTTMLIAGAQYFGFWTPLLFLGDWFNRRILNEDKRVLESSLPAEVPAAGDEKSVASDVATLHFRAWYRRQQTTSISSAGGGLVPVDSLRRDASAPDPTTAS